MMQFAEGFLNYEIVVTVSRQLSWSHFIILIPLKDNQDIVGVYYLNTNCNIEGSYKVK